MRTISPEQFEETLRKCPSITPEELTIALSLGVEAWANHARVVDNYEGPPALLATPGGLRHDRAMFFAEIATGAFEHSSSPFSGILPRLPG